MTTFRINGQLQMARLIYLGLLGIVCSVVVQLSLLHMSAQRQIAQLSAQAPIVPSTCKHSPLGCKAYRMATLKAEPLVSTHQHNVDHLVVQRQLAPRPLLIAHTVPLPPPASQPSPLLLLLSTTNPPQHNSPHDTSTELSKYALNAVDVVYPVAPQAPASTALPPLSGSGAPSASPPCPTSQCQTTWQTHR